MNHSSIIRAPSRPGTTAGAPTRRAEASDHDDPRRPETVPGLTPDEIRRIVLDILG